MPLAFVGRTAELTFLQQRLEQARWSGRSAVVVVSGEPGIGKTRLLGQFTAARSSVRTLRGRGPRSARRRTMA
ncbi:MAG TPA: AAA family ATPase [Actinomycetota bacterium]|nr:AAA family ATPase [Actinomycetota bacterium]